METFELDRHEDETGISGTGVVAQGVVFDDGTVALRWTTTHNSTAIYESMVAVEAIHGHKGKTTIVRTSEAYLHGRLDCTQDRYENSPFASVGGLGKRGEMVAPKYVSAWDEKEYLRGYRDAARAHFGDETCSFGWAPALEVPATTPPTSNEGSR